MNNVKNSTLQMSFHEVRTLSTANTSKQYIVCEEGVAWVTFAGDPLDYIIKAGERIDFDHRQDALVESLSCELKLRIKDCA